MKLLSLKIILLFSLILCCFADLAHAQSRSRGLDLFGTDRNSSKRTYNRYDLEDLFQQQLEDSIRIAQSGKDTSEWRNQLKISPEDLRKLGAPEELIEKIIELNAVQDTLMLTEKELRRKIREKQLGKAKDSISIAELNKLIEQQKEGLIEKALSLPEPIVFGQEFFRRSALEMAYDKVMERRDLRPSENYLLDIGDEVSVSMWGNIDYNKVFTIDDKGAINPDLVGRIYVRGLSYKAIKELIKNRYSQVYDLKRNQIDVAITHQRTVAANFVGELLYPGTYRFPAQTSVYNALVAINGPSQLGTVRNMHIRRDGATIKTLDLYDFLLNPDSRQDFFLAENDYVVVPPASAIVNLAGEVRRPYNYEIKPGETLEDVLGFAGGLKAEAFTKNINIKRYLNNHEVLIGVNYDSLRAVNGSFPLQNGDSIFVYRVPAELRTYVELGGAVRVPGRYQIKKGDRIVDVLTKCEGVLDEADLGRAYVLRLKQDLSHRIIPFNLGEILENPSSPENFLLQHLDTIQIVSRADFRQDFSVKIYGAVRKPGEYEYAENLTLDDLLYISGGMRKEAASNRIEVSRLVTYTDRSNRKDTTERIVIKRVEVSPDLSLQRNDEEFALMPYDHIFVRTSRDFEEQQVVKLYGEVVYPGEYTLTSKEERINSLVARAGGLTPYAFQQGSRLFREEDSIGFVLLNLHLAQKKPKKSKYNYILTAGDSIFIPKMKNIVTLTGAVRHFDMDSLSSQVSAPYYWGKRANFYIERHGGGFGRFAKKSRTFVRQPNGEIHAAKNYWLFKRYPKVENGATIFVDITDRKRYEKERRERRKGRSWNDAFDTLTAKVTTVLTVLLLVNQIRK